MQFCILRFLFEALAHKAKRPALSSISHLKPYFPKAGNEIHMDSVLRKRSDLRLARQRERANRTREQDMRQSAPYLRSHIRRQQSHRRADDFPDRTIQCNSQLGPIRLQESNGRCE